jgi:hypothetical protein
VVYPEKSFSNDFAFTGRKRKGENSIPERIPKNRE